MPSTTRLTAARIADDLRTGIFDGSLGPGVQLKQEQLANAFGVSRIPVREALSRLQAEGLVVHEPNKGMSVAAPTLGDVCEALDIRLALEARALALALPRMTEAGLARCERILARYDKATTPLEWTTLNLKFHLALYEPAQRPRLLAMIERIVTEVDRGVRTHISRTVGRDDPQADHYAIVAACRQHDQAGALRRLQRHIGATQRALMSAEATLRASKRKR
jgi:DNA-binding GntR family transcriptional regulator